MNVNGIIAEYNPFHNGHMHHLEEARNRTGADYTIIALGGNFMQRGAPALLDKYKRTEIALLNGADLVLEIPAVYAASSAEYFGTGAVKLLDKLGVVNNLCFGSECGETEILSQIADILVDEPESYKEDLRRQLRQGLSYPLARTWALIHYCPSLSNHKDVFSTPNNILGIEYIKALKRSKSTINPVTTKRIGYDYHDKRMGQKQCSAKAIREAVFLRPDFEFLENEMPESAYRIMYESLKKESPIHINDFSAALHYKLMSESEEGYEQYLDVSGDLSDRIFNNLFNFRGIENFCDLLKSKEMTYTRISRCLLHILLNMKKDHFDLYKELDYVPYARVLGFRKDAAPLLSAIKANSSIPLITKLADTHNILSHDAYDMLQQEIYINHIYESTAAMKAKRMMRNEYQIPIIIIE